jgi:hypothetical protein
MLHFLCRGSQKNNLIGFNDFIKSINCRYRWVSSSSREPEDHSLHEERARKRATQQKRKQDGSRFVDETVVNIGGGADIFFGIK